jgi:hypothetical protein
LVQYLIFEGMSKSARYFGFWISLVIECFVISHSSKEA